jgi:SAM-dependent methyltransferase
MQAMNIPCRVCGEASAPVGRKFGKYSGRWYELRHCPACRFSFVADPWTDFAAIYSEDYYRGKGADPLVNYEFELSHPDETTRAYEWEGLLRVVSGLVPMTRDTRWLDFGCGSGGLVRYVKQRAACDIVGFDEGGIVARARERGLPLVSRDELEKSEGRFDVITAVEVLEHIVDPASTVQLIRRLLKPGGLFFLTTGNARPFRDRLAKWAYVIPEIHISFFEPETLAKLMKSAGLEPEFRGWLPGFEKIIRFKILKSLGIHRLSLLERLLPLTCLARLADAHVGVTNHPIAWAGGQRTGRDRSDAPGKTSFK